ncbi:hypothetical protein [Salana multivorans]
MVNHESLLAHSTEDALAYYTAEAKRDLPLALLERLRNAGFAWRDVARLVGVSVPALQKWRRGDGVTPANRDRLARLVAVTEVLVSLGYQDPVAWLEMPVSEGVALSPMDILAGASVESVVRLASATVESEVQLILDGFDPEWRAKYHDDGFEVYRATDGVPSIRARS